MIATTLARPLGSASSVTVRSRTHSCRTGRRALVVRAHSDGEDDVLPLFRLPGPPGSASPPTNLPPPKLLGGKTIGEELGLLHQRYNEAETASLQAAEQHVQRLEQRLISPSWDGDVYRGGRWNVMTLLAAVGLATPLLGLLFAWATYGTLWGNYTL